MSGLAHDVAFVHAVHRRLRYAAGAEAVAPERFGFHAGAFCGILQNCSDRIFVKTVARDTAVTIDRPEQWTGLDVRSFQPAAHGTHGTGLPVLPERDADLA